MWLYKGKKFTQEDAEGYQAFVYIIRNHVDNRAYIGKKTFIKTRRKKSVRRKNRKVVKSASDWQSYWGSNKALQEDVKRLGEENFSREIVHLCKTKAEASYVELSFQMGQRVLESDYWYNDWIMCRIRKEHLNGLKY